jgi:hypothetical protein
MRLRSAHGLTLDAERSRFVDALSYYAALGIERVRLIAAVERAEALREADELKDALLASVSHDLRTPLTTIKARAHEMRIHGDEQAEVIEQEADRLNRIVVDLLDLSRLKAGVLPNESPDPCNASTGSSSWTCSAARGELLGHPSATPSPPANSSASRRATSCWRTCALRPTSAQPSVRIASSMPSSRTRAGGGGGGGGPAPRS